MLHLLWVGTTIGLAAALVRRLARSARPEVRYRARTARPRVAGDRSRRDFRMGLRAGRGSGSSRRLPGRGRLADEVGRGGGGPGTSPAGAAELARSADGLVSAIHPVAAREPRGQTSLALAGRGTAQPGPARHGTCRRRADPTVEPGRRVRRDSATLPRTGRFPGDRAPGRRRRLRSHRRADPHRRHPPADPPPARRDRGLECRTTRDGLTPRAGPPEAMG